MHDKLSTLVIPGLNVAVCHPCHHLFKPDSASPNVSAVHRQPRRGRVHIARWRYRGALRPVLSDTLPMRRRAGWARGNNLGHRSGEGSRSVFVAVTSDNRLWDAKQSGVGDGPVCGQRGGKFRPSNNIRYKHPIGVYGFRDYCDTNRRRHMFDHGQSAGQFELRFCNRDPLLYC